MIHPSIDSIIQVKKSPNLPTSLEDLHNALVTTIEEYAENTKELPRELESQLFKATLDCKLALAIFAEINKSNES